MSEWKECKLGEFVESISETYKFKPSEEVVFLNTSDIFLGQVINRELQNSAGLPGQAKKKIKRGDFIFSEIRPANGRYAMIDFDAENYVVSTKLMVLRCNDKIDRSFFRIFLTSKEQLEYLQMIAEDRSGTFPQITFDHISSLDILYPPLPEQRAIAGVFGSLDDKIDLLHRQNKTLEGMAEAIWRKMFVEEAYTGWKVGKIGDFIKTTSGGTPSRNRPDYYDNGNYKWVKSQELQGTFIIDTEEKINEEGLKNSSAKLLPKNTLLLAMYGATVGEYGILAEQATCNQAICALLPNELYPYTFIYMFLKMNKDEIINHAVGSAQQNISQIVIQSLEVFQPNHAIIQFHKTVDGLFEKIKSNILQIRTLSRLRDTLLPKLMSGEVRVKM